MWVRPSTILLGKLETGSEQQHKYEISQRLTTLTQDKQTWHKWPIIVWKFSSMSLCGTEQGWGSWAEKRPITRLKLWQDTDKVTYSVEMTTADIQFIKRLKVTWLAQPWKLPEGEQYGQFVVELLKLIKSAEDKLRLVLTFPHDPYDVRLQRRRAAGVSILQFKHRHKNLQDKRNTEGLT